MPAIVLVLAGMLATVLEATAKTGRSHQAAGFAGTYSQAVAAVVTEIGDDGLSMGDTCLTACDRTIKGQASILNLHALKAINGIVKELPVDPATSFQGTK